MSTTYRLHRSAFLILAASIIFAWPAQGMAARLVRAKISLDGKTLLEASTGDDGRVDADGVWEYLKSLKFKATEHFTALEVDAAAKETILTSDAPRGEPGTIIIDIAYGGKAITRKLKLVRVSIDKQGREWSVVPTEVDRMFDDRLIRRSDAARLDNVKNTKR